MTKLVMIGMILSLAIPETALAEYQDWQHSGSLYILTTPEGANLPETARVEGFPLLVRLDKDWFDFSQARTHGEDIRFATSAGAPLAYQIEQWDADAGTASIWVRVPVIKGNSHQELKMVWGKIDAVSESNGKAVFNESNGYKSVWHMNEPVTDEVGTITSKDEGTTATGGIVGQARHLAGKQGIFGGTEITRYPSGAGPMSTEAWFRAEKTNATVLAWGKEQRPGKVMMNFLSPPRVAIQCYFADVEAKSPLAVKQWYHVVHTYQDRDSRVYVNGRLDGVSTPVLDIPETSSLWIGGWYGNYKFIGDVDEVRISKVVRSADWVKLQYENQQLQQTLVGPLLQSGTDFAVSDKTITILEGKNAIVSGKAGGARKVYWMLKRGGRESVVAVDRFNLTFAAGRVTGDQSSTLQFKAVYADGVKTWDIPISVKESIPDPIFTLKAPSRWDGRETIEVVPQIANQAELQAKGVGDPKTDWTVSRLAVIKEITPDRLVLTRAQNSGDMAVTCTLSNGGAPVSSSITIPVQEPAKDAWVYRVPGKDEQPVDHQFYARDDKNEATLHYNGTLTEQAESVFLNVYAGDQLFKRESRQLAADKNYAFAVKLKPGWIKYKVDFGCKFAGTETVLRTVTDLVCGDAYIIEGQSNALATDTREEAPRETSEWIRSYGYPQDLKNGEPQNLWCNPVWKFEQGESYGTSRKEHKAELGWWGMELAERLVKSRKVPICIINGAAGGTRIDQHQRNPSDPSDVTTIYGRLLWRVREAKLTHGIRAVLWHQGESDQGADGPDGGYGWETYQRYFVDMSAAWKQDFPNIGHYYLFQIWPNSCSMGNGHGDMLREVQRTLPRLYSNMDIMSTLGIEPAGPCHYPLEGWAEFARLAQPLIERDLYGKTATRSITPPDLRQAYYTGDAKDAIALEFDQGVVWNDSLISEFYLDGVKDQVASGSVSENVLTLKLKEAPAAGKITYLKEMSWSQKRLLRGTNGIAALTFCDVPIRSKD
jgi:hypothetical protein